MLSLFIVNTDKKWRV